MKIYADCENCGTDEPCTGEDCPEVEEEDTDEDDD